MEPSLYASHDGRIRLRQRSMFRFPAAVEVSAPGFQKRRITVRYNDHPRIDIYLERIPRRIAVDGRTISVEELSGDNIERAIKLHSQAEELLNEGKPAEARTLLFAAERLHPSSATIKNSIGVTMLREGKIIQADEWLEAAFEMEPHNPDFAANLGLLRFLQRRSEESFALWRRAVELGCETETIHYLPGVLALRKQEWRLSQKQLSRIDPGSYPYSNLFLAAALHRMRETDDANEKFEEFLEQNPVSYFMASSP